MVCPTVQGDNPRAFASELSNVQADKPWYNYFTTIISIDLAQFKMFNTKDCDS